MLKTATVTIFFIMNSYNSQENYENEQPNQNRPSTLWRTILNNRTIDEITTNIDIVMYKNLQQALSHLLKEAGSQKTSEDFLNYPQRLKYWTKKTCLTEKRYTF